MGFRGGFRVLGVRNEGFSALRAWGSTEELGARGGFGLLVGVWGVEGFGIC